MDRAEMETIAMPSANPTEEEAEKFLDFANSLPNEEQAPLPVFRCPECYEFNATYEEIHPDTDINEVVLVCPDCGFRGHNPQQEKEDCAG